MSYCARNLLHSNPTVAKLHNYLELDVIQYQL